MSSFQEDVEYTRSVIPQLEEIDKVYEDLVHNVDSYEGEDLPDIRKQFNCSRLVMGALPKHLQYLVP